MASAAFPRDYMPDRYYSVALPAGATSPLVEFFVLDDTPVTSNMFQTDPYYAYDGPFMRAQTAWLDNGLGKSTATWKFVLAHHPYVNNGVHGNAGAYDGISIDLPGPFEDYTTGRHFKRFIEQVALGRCDLLLAGHDHTQQILDIGPRRAAPSRSSAAPRASKEHRTSCRSPTPTAIR